MAWQRLHFLDLRRVSLGVAGRQEQPLIRVQIAKGAERRHVIVQRVARLTFMTEGRGALRHERLDGLRRRARIGGRLEDIECLVPAGSIPHRTHDETIAAACHRGSVGGGWRGEDLAAHHAEQPLFGQHEVLTSGDRAA